MGIFNEFLNIMPYNCRYCVQGFKGMLHISQEARNQKLELIELQNVNAEKEPVWNTLTAFDPIFVNGFGHGNNDVYTGDSETPIFNSWECDILSGRIVYLLSCLTANGLGPAIINAGGIAYGGFKISWGWVSKDITADPYDDWYAEGFFRASNEFPIALIQGATINEAKQRSIAVYNQWIDIWETERADDPDSASAIKWLISDRDGLVILGDVNAVITDVGLATSLEITVKPPSYLRHEQAFRFEGILKESITGNPLAGRTVQIMIFERNTPLVTLVTNSNGQWSCGISLPKGFYRLYAIFKGDEQYRSTFTDIYKVYVGTTQIVITTPPPESMEQNEVITITGFLREEITGIALPNKVINLYQAGVTYPIGTTTTDASGVWEFNITYSEKGRFSIYVKFHEDIEYLGSQTLSYEIAVGTLLSFGRSTKANIMVTASQMISGSIFLAPEKGLVYSIVCYQQLSSIYRGKHACAIYRASDLKLLGITDERKWETGTTGWIMFVFSRPIPIEAGEEYLLIAWGTLGCSLYFDRGYPNRRYAAYNYDIKRDYPNFPDPFIRDTEPGMTDGLVSIYAEYVPAVEGQHQLIVMSSPELNVPVSTNGNIVGYTPITKLLATGEHVISVPEEVTT